MQGHPTERGLHLLQGLLSMMPGWARVNRKVLDPPACRQSRGLGTRSKDGNSGKLHRSRRRPARGGANALNFKADASWLVHHPADGVLRAWHQGLFKSP
jgi:hypothetical protein